MPLFGGGDHLMSTCVLYLPNAERLDTFPSVSHLNYFYFVRPINTNTCVLCLLLENVRMLTHMVVSFYLVLCFGSVLCGSILYGALFNVLCTGYVSVGYVSGTA